MNCDECIERVFELIEEEALDAERVRAILDRCPDCRALFEETKAALELVEDLPLEEPPAELDAAIRRAAREKLSPSKSASRPAWMPRASHWAMAAVAMLAIGLGLWARPRSVLMEEEHPVGDAPQEARELDAQQAPVEPPPAREAPASAAAPKAPRPEPTRRKVAARESLANAESAALEEQAQLGQASAAGGIQQTEGRARLEAKGAREERADVTKKAARAPAAAAVAEPAPAADLADEAAGPSPRSAQERESLEDAALRACRELVATQARREAQRQKDRKAPVEPSEPEAQLRLGICYRRLGSPEQARPWLERARTQAATRDRANAELRALEAE